MFFGIFRFKNSNDEEAIVYSVCLKQVIMIHFSPMMNVSRKTTGTMEVEQCTFLAIRNVLSKRKTYILNYEYFCFNHGFLQHASFVRETNEMN